MAEMTPIDRRALQAVAVQFFVNGVVVASYVPRLPEIRSNIDASLFTIGWVLSVATIGGVVGASLVGRATEVLRTKTVMLIGAGILILMLPSIGFVNAVWQLLLVLSVIQAADVFTDVAMNVQGSALSARRSRPVMNRLHAMWSLGTVVGG
ncbi:MAG: MFS transporter, partial [Acidimicrobiales bacterium]